VIAISSASADADLTAKFDLYDAAPYCISKIALNMAVAKFSAEYATKGVLFMTISPGVVDMGYFSNGKNSLEHNLQILHGLTLLQPRRSRKNQYMWLWRNSRNMHLISRARLPQKLLLGRCFLLWTKRAFKLEMADLQFPSLETRSGFE